MTPALVGGPVAHSSDLLTLRYLAAANLELTYRNQVILLSTYYKLPQVVNVPDVKRADTIFMGHEDGDHDEQALQVVKQTGALLYGNANVMAHAKQLTVCLKARVLSLRVEMLLSLTALPLKQL